MTDISYDEAVATIQRQQKVDYATACLMVAELYPRLSLDEVDESVAFDPIDTDEGAGLVYHRPLPAGKVVPVDEDRSPQGSIAAMAARLEAQRNGDRYREISRHVGGHYHT